MVAALLLAAPLMGGALSFDCDMAMPNGRRFVLQGTFDGERLQSNIARWPGLSLPTDLAGGQQLSVENVVHHYEWNGSGSSRRSRLKVQMVEYSREHAATLVVLDHFSDGRHSVDSLVGIGLCETRRGSAETVQ